MSLLRVYGFVNTEFDRATCAVQFGHACLQMAEEHGRLFSSLKNVHLVLFGISGERGIIDTASLLRDEVSTVPFSMFYEPDHDLGYTAICTTPVQGVMQEAFSGFQLLDK
jgi:hypothetical protein